MSVGATGAEETKAPPAEKRRWVYFFGDGRAEGSARMRDLLGGKGAGIAEMVNAGIPVPPGKEESVVGQGIQVKATSNFWPWLTVVIGNSGTFRYPDNTIRGYIDGAPYDGNQVFVSGWACAGGITQSVNVHVYAGGPAGIGSWAHRRW